MRTTIRSFLCSSLALFTACGGPSGPVDGNAAFEHVRYLVEEIGPRPFGSPGLEKATEYFEGELKTLGLNPQRHEVDHEAEGKTIRNLYVKIDGKDPVDGPILMFGAHYDTKLTEGHEGNDDHNFDFVGAIDGGGAPAVLLELARIFKEMQPELEANIWLYWIDAEESVDFHWNDDRALLGSKAFCKFLDEEKLLKRVKAFVLLDLIGDKDIKIDKDGNSHAQLQKIFEKAAADMGESERVYKYESTIKDDHETFRNFGVPSVLLIDFHLRIPDHLVTEQGGTPLPNPHGYSQWWHTPDDTLDKMSPDSLAFTGNLVMQAFPDLQDFVIKRHR